MNANIRKAAICEIVVADDADSWRSAGFAVSVAGIAHVGSVRLKFAGREQHPNGGIVSWAVRGIATADDLDGLATEVVDMDAETRNDGEPLVTTKHPNTSTSIDHVVVSTPDIDRTIAAFVAVGMEPRRERAGGSKTMPLRQVFLRMGEVIIEVVGPPVVPDDPAVRARPAAFWGLAFSCSDIDGCAAMLGQVGMGTVREAVQPGRRIGSLRHEHFGISVPTVFMTE